MDNSKRKRTGRMTVRTYPEILDNLGALARLYTDKLGYEVSRTEVIEMLVTRDVKSKAVKRS